MTATVTPTDPTTATTSTTTATPVATTRRRRHPLLVATVLSGVLAAAATTVIAAAAAAADVPLAIDGDEIPLVGFPQMTLIGAVLGGLLVAALDRWSARARRRFEVIAAALTVASCLPSLALPPDTATKLVLVATHVVAAAIIVPALARCAR